MENDKIRIPITVSFDALLRELDRRTSVEYFGGNRISARPTGRSSACNCRNCLDERLELHDELSRRNCPSYLSRHLNVVADDRRRSDSFTTMYFEAFGSASPGRNLCDCSACKEFRSIKKVAGPDKDVQMEIIASSASVEVTIKSNPDEDEEKKKLDETSRKFVRDLIGPSKRNLRRLKKSNNKWKK